MQQNKNTVAPDLKLNKVEPSQVNYRNVINANLQNLMAGYLNQMYVQAEVKGVSNSKLSYKANKEMLQMAPNSNFDYPVSIGDGNKLEAGKYRLSMTVYGQKIMMESLLMLIQKEKNKNLIINGNLQKTLQFLVKQQVN